MKNLIFDFDSTFIQIESLDLLAEHALVDSPDKDEKVRLIADITKQGMEGMISFTESLERRLALFDVTQEHILNLVPHLKKEVSRSIVKHRDRMTSFSDTVRIISGGFKEYIVPVCADFGIPSHHVFANEFLYDENGRVIGIDTTNPLARSGGKVEVVQSLGLEGSSWMIGDGYTDYEVRESGAVQGFVYFAENIERPLVSSKADMVVKSFDELMNTLAL